ncbi:hypothetical protein [Streptomyces acidiscabies]|uniref:Glycosyl transferase family 2 n=1 Tax=Streptomyces acidiscabies TaxID=42234 RepID=A0ABU4MA79_9ACTN|nr:hypothetical protein [Streptomyces acidiscabies]MDX3024067.1 hypothetical protein [Streptomyces acidiscabies]
MTDIQTAGETVCVPTEPPIAEALPAPPGGDGLVQMAYLHQHSVSHSWHESVMRLVAHDSLHHGRLLGTGGPLMVTCGSGALAESRNLATRQWLDDTPHEWLWFVDTDMGFAPDTVDRLLNAADPAERPIVGALCFAAREVASDGMGGRRIVPAPTLYRPATDEQGQTGFTTRWHYPDNTLVQAAGTGAACLLIHRTAAQAIRDRHGDTWWDPVKYPDGRWVSEDLSFCWRLSVLGIPLFVHTGVKTTHHKHIWLGADDYTPPPTSQQRAAPHREEGTR